MVTNPYIARLAIESHIDDLRRAAAGQAQSRTTDGDARRRADQAGVPLAARRFPRLKRATVPASGPCA